MKTLVALFAASILSIPALAQEVDLKKSEIAWKASKKLGSSHNGTVKLKSAKATLKDGKIQSGEFVVDMKSIENKDIEDPKMKAKFLGHIKSEDFFKVDTYPTSKLVVEKQSGKGEVSGKLTILDRTHPVKIKFTEKDGVYTGKYTFDRTKYGIVYGAGNIFKELTADKVINNEVELEFKIVLKKK